MQARMRPRWVPTAPERKAAAGPRSAGVADLSPQPFHDGTSAGPRALSPLQSPSAADIDPQLRLRGARPSVAFAESDSKAVADASHDGIARTDADAAVGVHVLTEQRVAKLYVMEAELDAGLAAVRQQQDALQSRSQDVDRAQRAVELREVRAERREQEVELAAEQLRARQADVDRRLAAVSEAEKVRPWPSRRGV
jgi:hypothetical protein